MLLFCFAFCVVCFFVVLFFVFCFFWGGGCFVFPSVLYTREQLEYFIMRGQEERERQKLCYFLAQYSCDQNEMPYGVKAFQSENNDNTGI